MPWAFPLTQKILILNLARSKYLGFNDSHLCQKLNAEENLPVSRETVRRILRGAKLASPQKRRPRKYRSRRLPRSRFGMIALTDASTHDWLEGRGPQLTLIGFQDDATKQILAAHFQLEAENTVGYLRALHSMITTHGVPLSLYRDRHSIFQRNDAYWTVAEQLAGQQTPTHFGRALADLGIQQIPAYSPQAKGRVERLWRTCQDRLVSELRLARPLPWTRPTLCWPPFVSTTTAASPIPRLIRPVTFALCPGASISPAVSVFAISASSAPTTSSPSAPCLHVRAGALFAGDTVELFHQLDGSLCVYRGDQLLLSQTLPLQEHTDSRPALRTTAQKRKLPRIYNLSGRPAVAAVT